MDVLVDARDVGQIDMMMLAVARRILGQLDLFALDRVDRANPLSIRSDDVHMLANLAALDHIRVPCSRAETIRLRADNPLVADCVPDDGRRVTNPGLASAFRGRGENFLDWQREQFGNAEGERERARPSWPPSTASTD